MHPQMYLIVNMQINLISLYQTDVIVALQYIISIKLATRRHFYLQVAELFGETAFVVLINILIYIQIFYFQICVLLPSMIDPLGLAFPSKR